MNRRLTSELRNVLGIQSIVWIITAIRGDELAGLQSSNSTGVAR